MLPSSLPSAVRPSFFSCCCCCCSLLAPWRLSYLPPSALTRYPLLPPTPPLLSRLLYTFLGPRWPACLPPRRTVRASKAAAASSSSSSSSSCRPTCCGRGCCRWCQRLPRRSCPRSACCSCCAAPPWPPWHRPCPPTRPAWPAAASIRQAVVRILVIITSPPESAVHTQPALHEHFDGWSGLAG